MKLQQSVRCLYYYQINSMKPIVHVWAVYFSPLFTVGVLFLVRNAPFHNEQIAGGWSLHLDVDSPRKQKKASRGLSHSGHIDWDSQITLGLTQVLRCNSS